MLRKYDFEELIERNDFASIRCRDIKVLATEMYKTTNGLSPEITTDIFQPRRQRYLCFTS